MLKQQAKLFNNFSVLVDSLTIVFALMLAYHIRSFYGGLYYITSYLWALLPILPIWYFLLDHFELYASLRTRTISQIISSLLKVHIIGGIIVSSIIYFIDHRGFSRALFANFLIISFIFLSIEKTCVKLVLGFLRKRGFNFRNILVAGTDSKARKFIKTVEAHAQWGLKIAGILKADNAVVLERVEGYKVLGSLKNLVEVCKATTVDEVVFCLPKELLTDVEEYLKDMEEMGITVRMVLDFYDVRQSSQELSLFHGEIPMITFYNKAFDAGQLFLKRCLDIAGAVVGLAFTALLCPFIAVAIKLDSPGPLLFGQERIGENGRVFRCWKFRSMYVDAEERKKELMHLNEMKGAIFKLKDDPRITKVGNFLRKTSLDELPQFWNVLRGEMSLVGTRPPTPDEVAKYENWHRRRICIKPGITGLWQVSGRNRIQDFDEIVKLDLGYIDKWSIWLDIKIIFKTIWVVFARTGSC